MVQLVGGFPQHPQRSSALLPPLLGAFNTHHQAVSDAPFSNMLAAETHLSVHLPPRERRSPRTTSREGQTPTWGEREQESALQANASSQDHSNPPRRGKTPHIEKSPTVPIFLGAAAVMKPGSPDSAVGTLRNALPQDSAQPEADKSSEPAQTRASREEAEASAIAEATAMVPRIRPRA